MQFLAFMVAFCGFRFNMHPTHRRNEKPVQVFNPGKGHRTRAKHGVEPGEEALQHCSKTLILTVAVIGHTRSVLVRR